VAASLPVLNPVVVLVLRAGTGCAVLRGSLMYVHCTVYVVVELLT